MSNKIRPIASESANSYPRWILERAFGGIKVADSPLTVEDTSRWPSGVAAPMAKEVCDVLANVCRNNGDLEDDPSCFIFLIGGAGNGKSRLAGETVKKIEAQQTGDLSTMFAQRTYEFSLKKSARTLKILNDATIPATSTQEHPGLAGDIAVALTGRQHLLACVNRGVLIGEVNSFNTISKSEEVSISRQLVKWLMSDLYNRPPSQENENGTYLDIEYDNVVSHYRFSKVYINKNLRAVVHVVAMDEASQLEKWECGSTSEIIQQPLACRKLIQTPILERKFIDDQFAMFSDPVVNAASTYLQSIKNTGSIGELDPVVANAKVLSSKCCAEAWCALLRGAEIISGAHFTYRELWALFSHSIVGPARVADLQVLRKWVRQKVEIARDGNSTSNERVQAWMALGQLRLHMNLFDAGRKRKFDAILKDQYEWVETTSEALESISQADPLRDFGPSDGSFYTKILDRLAHMEEESLPSVSLIEESPLIKAYWTEFDTCLEQSIAEFIKPTRRGATIKERNAVFSWYAKYLFRLISVAQGWPAHCTLINEWQCAWCEVQRKHRLPNNLENAILGIVLPLDESQNNTYFPIMKSRVSPPRVDDSVISISIPRNRFELHAEIRGDLIVLKITRIGNQGSIVAETVLDFHLLREALAQRHGRGFTESLAFIEPRIERIRASLLTSQISGDAQHQSYKVTHKGAQAHFAAPIP